MSKYSSKGNENNYKDYFIDSKLKEVKESNLKYSNMKDVELISNTFLRESNDKIYDSSKKLSKQMPTIEDYDNNHIINYNENETEKGNITDKEEKEKENISNEVKNNDKYIEKIKELEDIIKQMNLDFSNDIKKHKDEIEKKEKDIKKLIITNNNLKNSLEILTQRLDRVLINSTQQKLKLKKENNNNQEDLQHKLDIKEKELKNQQQLINILTKDNKNLRNILNNFRMDESNMNLSEKIQQQYKEIQSLQKNLKEYKLKLSLSQKNIDSKKLDFKTNDENLSPKKSNFFFNRNNKLTLNSLTGGGYGKFGRFTNKSQSIDLNHKNKRKKIVYQGLNSSYINNVEPVFTSDEINTIKNSFIDEHKYENFINKLNILEKAANVKDKEMVMKIKIFENKLKQKEKELNEIKNKSKEKDTAIIALNLENKELKKNRNDLIYKINFLSKTLNELAQKNEMIIKKNEQIKNSIFSIDGIMEAKNKDGNPIPLLVEVNNGNLTLEKSNPPKNGNDSINQSSGEEKNSFKFTNSDENGGDN